MKDTNIAQYLCNIVKEHKRVHTLEVNRKRKERATLMNTKRRRGTAGHLLAQKNESLETGAVKRERDTIGGEVCRVMSWVSEFVRCYNKQVC